MQPVDELFAKGRISHEQFQIFDMASRNGQVIREGGEESTQRVSLLGNTDASVVQVSAVVVQDAVND
jgi:hypothetical protein